MTATEAAKNKKSLSFPAKNEKLKRVININNYTIKCAHRKEVEA